jgi:ankyrin repeat protein
MAKAKQKTHEPNFHDFLNACAFNLTLAHSMLRKNSAWLSATNSLDETALAYLVVENYRDAAKFLIEAGADINTRDMSGATPLIQAAGLGYQEMVSLLLERGADANARDDDQETALFKAVRHGYIEICESLLVAGAEGQLQNDMTEHLWDVALPRKREKVLSVLARHGYREPAQAAV